MIFAHASGIVDTFSSVQPSAFMDTIGVGPSEWMYPWSDTKAYAAAWLPADVIATSAPEPPATVTERFVVGEEELTDSGSYEASIAR